MNELIKDLFETYTHLHDADNSQIICIEDFKQAIQTACKAQRNACWREYIDMIVFRKPGESEDFIKNAEIERCDYE